MNILDVLRGLMRRWYISVPGLMLAAAAAVGAWSVTSPEYERTATQLLLPGDAALPEGESNLYLYMGGLSPVADVLARAVGAGDAVQDFREKGAEISIARDGSVSGPLVVTTVTAASDSEAADIIVVVMKEMADTLERLQAEQNVALNERVIVSTIAVDDESTVLQRSRIVVAAGAGLALATTSLLVASLVDGLATRRRHRRPSASQRTGEMRESGPFVDEDIDVAEQADQAPADHRPDGDPPRLAVPSTRGDVQLDDLEVERLEQG